MGFNDERYAITCCKDCPERYPGCHGKCEKYKKARAEYDEKMAEHRKKYDVACSIAKQHSDSIQRITRNQHYKSKYRKGH